MADIVVTGLSANDPVPGEYAEVIFAAGEASRGTSVYSAVLLGNKLDSGAATEDTVIYGPDTAVPLTSEDEAISLFGEGSELHRMYRRFVKINSTTPLYAVAVAEDGYSTESTGTISIVGPATGAGTLRIFVADEFVDVGFATGDTAADIATAGAVQVNSKSYWPVIAFAVGDDIQLESKQKGLRANFIRYFAQVKPFTGTGIDVTPLASTTMSGGAGSDDNALALVTIADKRFYYQVSAAEDVDQLTAHLTQINSQALPITGLRNRLFAGSVDTLANTITITTALNGARAEIEWLQESDVPPCELASHNAGVFALEEAPIRPKLNFDFYGDGANDQWQIRAPKSGKTPSRSQIYAALNAGVTPIGVRESGSTYLVKRITTRYKNGAVVDYRIRDSHKVTISDRYTDDMLNKFAAQFRGKEIGNDPKKNEPTPGPNVVTPRVVKAAVDRLTDDYFEDDLLQNPSVIKTNTQVVRSSAPKTRIGVQVPLQPIDILDQIAAKVLQVA